MSQGNYSNPYSAPSGPGSNFGNSSGVGGKLSAPGIALIVVGSLGLLLMGGYLILMLIVMATQPGNFSPPPNANDGERVGFYIGSYGTIAMMALSPFLQTFVIWGGINMVRQKGRAIAMLACLISVIPCCSSLCLMGIPFGIWGFVVLSDPQVKSLMEKN